MSDKPRSPDDHDQTGTGTPRSDDRGPVHAGGAAGEPVDPAVVTGATATSSPAEADELAINRSGSGGSGGMASDDTRDSEAEDGSNPESMAGLLGGDDQV